MVIDSFQCILYLFWWVGLFVVITRLVILGGKFFRKKLSVLIPTNFIYNGWNYSVLIKIASTYWSENLLRKLSKQLWSKIFPIGWCIIGNISQKQIIETNLWYCNSVQNTYLGKHLSHGKHLFERNLSKASGLQNWSNCFYPFQRCKKVFCVT